jgi:hypothetical protein
MDTAKPSSVDRNSLPELFPTNFHPPQFWEQLGRTIATFGFLEEMLGKAVLAFTGTREYEAQEIEAAYKAWLPKLEKALFDDLHKLAESYEKAVREHQDSTVVNVSELVENIKKAAKTRNVLCHGSWRVPDIEGKSLPLFVNRNIEIFETRIDIQFLRQVQDHVRDLACDVIDTVTQMGWRFPGADGPGETIWPTTAVVPASRVDQVNKLPSSNDGASS